VADKKDQKPQVKFITPKGVAIYPKLNKPDTKFKAEGEYSVKLRLSPDAIPAETVEEIQALLDAFAVETKAGLKQAAAKALKVLTLAEQGLKPEVNDDGDETGYIILKAGMKASGKSKKDGKEWTRAPVIFDAKGTKLKPVPPIWGGSELKLAVIAAPYYAANDKTCGITFYLDAVQVIKLVNSSDKDAAGFGFGEEEGFEGEESESFPDGDDASSTGEAAKSGDDF
jgi:hypothetical protein